jgi:SAM-dependent methyltransferase
MANTQFWNDRYRADEYIYGTAPNAFLARAALEHVPDPPAELIDLGAGEGRTAVFFATRGYDVLALDASSVGLRKANQLAASRGVSIETEEHDLTRWTPDVQVDAVLCSFLHFSPDDRPRLYRMMQQAVRPGGVVIAEWFRPEQITGGYDSGGPPDLDLMITSEELRAHFPDHGLLHCADASPTLDEGAHHRGPAATVRLVWRKKD